MLKYVDRNPAHLISAAMKTKEDGERLEALIVDFRITLKPWHTNHFLSANLLWSFLVVTLGT